MNKKGFTLIELIIVIAIIALLAASVFVAVDPAKRIGEGQDAKRWTDVIALADAWATYVAEHSGTDPATLTAGVGYEIDTWGKSSVGGTDCAATSTADSGGSPIDLDILVDQGYIGTIPYDPNSNIVDGTTSTNYYIVKYDNGAIHFGACDKYGTKAIQVVR